jgi:hypothetical protein
MELLSGMGCDLVQGYDLARPKPLSEFADWLATQSLKNRAEPDAPDSIDRGSDGGLARPGR